MYKGKQRDWQRANGFEPGKPVRLPHRSGLLTVLAWPAGKPTRWGWTISDGNGKVIAESNEGGVLFPHTEQAAALCDGVNWAHAIRAAELDECEFASPSHGPHPVAA